MPLAMCADTGMLLWALFLLLLVALFFGAILFCAVVVVLKWAGGRREGLAANEG